MYRSPHGFEACCGGVGMFRRIWLLASMLVMTSWTLVQAQPAVDLAATKAKLSAVIKPEVLNSLNDGQYAALASLAYSMPSFDRRHAGTLISRLNAGDLNGARDAFALYSRVGGWESAGLAARRADEMRLWNTGKATR